MRLKETFNIEVEELLKALEQCVQATGWGIVNVQHVNFKQATATITVKDCFEAAAWRRKPYPACHWTRGYFAVFMGTVFAKPVEAVEVKCMAKGDEHCEFQIKERI